MNDKQIKAINIIHYDGDKIIIPSSCTTHTGFKPGDILQATIYDDAIIITAAIPEDNQSLS